MKQNCAFETTDYPLADAFESADAMPSKPQPKAIATRRPTPPPPKPIWYTGKCLQCGKPTNWMFCGAACKATFIAAGERFAARMARMPAATETVSMI